MRPLLRRALRVPDLDRPWRDLEYCVVDVEATGLDLRRDELVAFGSVLVRSGRLCLETAVHTHIRPPVPVGPGAIGVHGLRDQDLEAAPPLADVIDLVVDQLDGRLLVAHAAWVERAFLARAVRSAGRRYDAPVVDTAALLRVAGLAPSGTGYEPDIEAMAEALGLCVHTPHDALGDALTTGEVFLALASRLERAVEAPVTADDLVRTSQRHMLT
jgi:DNA polymerase-3 subunit epsilon